MCSLCFIIRLQKDMRLMKQKIIVSSQSVWVGARVWVCAQPLCKHSGGGVCLYILGDGFDRERVWRWCMAAAERESTMCVWRCAASIYSSRSLCVKAKPNQMGRVRSKMPFVMENSLSCEKLCRMGAPVSLIIFHNILYPPIRVFIALCARSD